MKLELTRSHRERPSTIVFGFFQVAQFVRVGEVGRVKNLVVVKNLVDSPLPVTEGDLKNFSGP